MARISLRAYNRDIEVMIDKNQIDEAFAHCRYILELYPKHINTYRLMGKALLEVQRFGDASDVFHRVLSSVPDDFIAHLGMSIIREDESNLDAAIWHMERSFEVQPSNAAVQVELRRLYGLRDGVTPQKIQLTRGALARMSAKSNLHSQAIAELRSALSNDPQRPDLLVVLAEMYLQTGSRMEAIETCNALINKLPYCLTANRILAEVLPETERADQAHEYKTRLGELDPYNLQLSPVAPTLGQVPDGAVTIERFEYTGETFETEEADQPAWAASLGVDLDDEQSLPDETTPDWFEEGVPESEAESPPEVESDVEPAEIEDLDLVSDEESEDGSEEIPDWMGDTDDSEEKAEPVMDSDAESDEEIGEGEVFTGQVDVIQDADEVPDWMRDVDEAEDQEESGSIPGIAAAAGAAALGAAIAGQEDDEVEAELEEEQAAEEVVPDEDEAAEPLPDWMAAVEVEGDQLTTDEPDDVEAGEPAAIGQEDLAEIETDIASDGSEDTQEVPDWMSEAEIGDKGDAPDWLKDAMDSTDEEQESLSGAAAVAAGAAILSDDDDLEPVIEAETDLEAEIPSTPQLEPEADEAIETADESAEEFMLDDDINEDLFGEAVEEDLTSEDSDEEISEEAGIAAGGAALAGAALAGAALGASMEEENEAALSAEDELSPLPSEAEEIGEVEEEVPDWLQDLGEGLPDADEAGAPPVIFEDQPADEEIPAEKALDASAEDVELEDIPETPAAEDEELIPEQLAAQEDVPFEEGDFPESIPVWLSEVSPEEIPEEIAEAEAELDIVRAEIPVWLRRMEDQHKAELEAANEVDSIEDLELEGEFTELSGEDVPSWLMSAMEPELQAEVDEISAVEDISEVFEADEPVGIDEMGLVSSIAEEIESEGAEDLEIAELEDELVPEEMTTETLIETDEPTIEASKEIAEGVDEHLEPEFEAGLESEDIAEELEPVKDLGAEVTEEVDESIGAPGIEAAEAAGIAEEFEPGEDIGAEVTEEEDEGIGVPGLVAAGAAGIAAAHLLDEEDTQPIAVTDETEPSDEIETEVTAEEPFAAVEAGDEGLEVEEDSAEQVLEPEGDIPPPTEIEEAEVPAFAAEAPLSGEEEDAAMAWLESLAAKQGAAEEELLTPADERLEEPPEWVQEEASEVETSADEDIDEQRDTALTAAALAGVAAGILAGDEDSEEEPLDAQPEGEDLDKEPPEWVPEVLEEEEQVLDAETDIASEGIEIEPEPLEIEEEPDLVEELAAAAGVDLDQVETEELAADAEIVADEVEPDDISEEIPGWLSGLADEQEAVTEPEAVEWSPDMLAEEVEEPAAPLEAAPAEKLDINAASLAQLEKIPGIGFIYAQNIVNHRASSGSFTDLEQLGDIEGLTPEMVADLEEYLTVEVVAEVSASESEIPELQNAWDDIAEGNIDQAVDRYLDLINQDHHLDEVIRDLQSAVNKYPSDSGLYQCLGDAYMHSNMLQEALDAYNRAEDLI